MKESKTAIFKMRLTPEEKQKLVEYAEKHNLSMTEAVKKLCEKIFKGEK